MKHNVQIDAEAFGKFIDFVEGLKSSIVKQPEPVQPQTEWVKIDGVDHDPRYEQVVKVEPHAELRAMYEQQVKDGTLADFVWEYRDKYQIGAPWTMTIKPNFTSSEYRCTPKPTCQVRNLDTGELKTMTRDAAQKLQAELGDTVDWQLSGVGRVSNSGLNFKMESVYSYKLKSNLVKLDGELMTREAAIAKWESQKDTHGAWFKSPIGIWVAQVGNDCNFLWPAKDGEYKLRGTVRLTIDDEPAKMLTPAQCNAETLARIDTHDIEVLSDSHKSWELADSEFLSTFEYRLIRKQPKLISLDWTQPLLKGCATNFGEWLRQDDGDHPLYSETILHNEVVHNDLIKCHLVKPANWRVYIEGETDLSSLKGVEIELKCVLISGSSRLVEVDKAYSSEFMEKLPFIKAYRITGLAEGYAYGGEA